MFTGIIQALGRIQSLTRAHAAQRVVIDSGGLALNDVRLGDSIAVSGPCLTVTALSGTSFAVDVSPETLRLTTLGALAPGTTVNLEKALALGERLGGHLVSGHVDGVGIVAKRELRGEFVFFRITAPAAMSRYIATKGSISVEGVSLTVNAIEADAFELLLIPHTLSQTTLGTLQIGSRVNLEVDLIARYLERLLTKSALEAPVLGLESLRAAGFLNH
ncbi:MAG: riboflavin synthase [Gammaproteobacteria bacterium]|nr:riboflavin synthase [Gammaproteobacteria bacterium]